MEQLILYLKSLGFDYVPVCDGKVNRFGRGGGKDNAWFIGFQNHSMKSAEPFVVAEFGDWRTAEEHTYKPVGIKVTREEMAIIQKGIAAAREKAEREREEKQEETAVRSLRNWDALKDYGATGYTTRKKITHLKGTKRDEHGNLVIPCRDIEGKLWGLQRIAQDGSKRFSGGQRVKGTFFLLAGEIEKGDELYLCEGWATAASVYMATQINTACAFNASNLVEVARAVKSKFPLLRITVCGDADEVGRAKGQKAADICQGKFVAPDEGDWNDVHCRDGLEAVKAALVDDTQEDHGYVPLGFNGSTHYFYLKESRDVFSTATFSEVHLLNIAPRSHWAARFESKMGVDWMGARDHLISTSRAIGPFDVSRVRGTGVWLDDNRTVINSGYELVVDGKKMTPSKFKSRFIYIQTTNRFPLTTLPALTVEECQPIVEFADLISFGRKDMDSTLLLGWLAVARIAGALPIRPHIWITGGKGTGKSTLMGQFIDPLLGGPQGKVYVQGGSTEAGIRQTVGASSRPMIMDEAETIDRKSKELLSGIQDLNRQAWSNSKGVVIKGSATGQAVEFHLSYCALMSSIRVSFSNDADKSRYSVLELHKPKMSNGEMLQRLSLINEELGERLFKRSCEMIHIIRANYEILFEAISAVRGNRVAQQNAMLIAGAHILEFDEVITKEDADDIARDERFLSMVDGEEPVEDCMDCLQHLLTSKIRICVSGDSVERTVEEIISDDKIWQWQELRNYGIVFKDDGFLTVANCHAELKKIYGNTPWINWSHSLRRINGATSGGTIKFGLGKQRSTKIPLKQD